MKKVQPWIVIMSAAVLFVSSVQAGHYDRTHRYERHERMSHHHGGNWVVPMVIGGVLGYALSEPRRDTISYVQNNPVVCAPQPMYQEQWVYFSDCDCQRKVLVRVR